MSRIGNTPVKIPEGVELKINEKNHVHAKGPKGELEQKLHPDIIVKQEDGEVNVSRPTEQRRHKALHGLTRSLINNLVEGVSKGYEVKLELVGIGYKTSAEGNILHVSVGYSHDIAFEIPEELSVATETKKGSNPTITISGIDKQLVGQVASKVRGLRPPEPYKGKGIRYVGEDILTKAGKSGSKK